MQVLDLHNAHLERTLFRVITALAIVYEIYGISIGFIYGYTVASFVVDSLLLLFFMLFHFLSYRLAEPEKKLSIPLCLIIYAGLLYFWFQGGGLTGGSIGFIATGAMIVMILIPPQPYNLLFPILFFLTELALVILESFYPDWFNTEGIKAGLPSLPSTFLLLNFMVGGLITFLKLLYDRERDSLMESQKLLEERAKIIQERNEELSRQKTEIEKINADLELRVKERTRLISQQKKQLEEFTYLNAHKLRGAITRIMGLSSLLKGKEKDAENLTGLIDDSAREADHVVQEITRKITRDSEN